eukprot:TRINITY_DN774637_c0_g1_i1.p1 TRINITY_DN774637_c0_g1~~TRINITY_DN774637_c0_g1_i1.p1  ORF type:complete len:152 (-),score=20.08 TRINITY_DN774637_c0_g1_i1:118-573(-)
MNNELEQLRLKFNQALIGKLIDVYGTKQWKYRFIKNLYEEFGVKVQRKQLKAFESGASRSSNFIVAVLAEIQRCDPNFEWPDSNIGKDTFEDVEEHAQDEQVSYLEMVFQLLGVEIEIEKVEKVWTLFELIQKGKGDVTLKDLKSVLSTNE